MCSLICWEFRPQCQCSSIAGLFSRVTGKRHCVELKYWHQSFPWLPARGQSRKDQAAGSAHCPIGNYVSPSGQLQPEATTSDLMVWFLGHKYQTRSHVQAKAGPTAETFAISQVSNGNNSESSNINLDSPLKPSGVIDRKTHKQGNGTQGIFPQLFVCCCSWFPSI